MTKAELIERIARSRDLPPELTKKCIGQILDIAFGEMSGYFARAKITRAQSPRFTFPGFGTFTKKKRSARRGVNPRTLEPMDIDACETIDFKPGAELRRAMNPGSGAASQPANPRKSATRGKAEQHNKEAASGRRASGPNGRLLLGRDEADLELPRKNAAAALPDAPLRRVGRQRKSGAGNTG